MLSTWKMPLSPAFLRYSRGIPEAFPRHSQGISEAFLMESGQVLIDDTTMCPHEYPPGQNHRPVAELAERALVSAALSGRRFLL